MNAVNYVGEGKRKAGGAMKTTNNIADFILTQCQ
jgi:hypothetical protein